MKKSVTEILVYLKIAAIFFVYIWRKSKDSSFQNVRYLQYNIFIPSACPICRVISYYIIPSFFFPQTVKEKTVIIENYKAALKQKHCVHFNHGVSVCPFSTSCFFRHGMNLFIKFRISRWFISR
ncbi:hypothetical protein HZS_5316 [Henneguya salminicola]|nr:hypothetical protein HZS_5316 [Henneguya salminicola]